SCVHQQEKNEPDDVDEVPIEADRGNAAQYTIAAQAEDRIDHQGQAADDVKRVQAGHRKVERPEDADARCMAARDLVGIFETFEAEKEEAECKRRQEKSTGARP